MTSEEWTEEQVGPYRGGRVHVLAKRCKSCLFRSVNDGRIMGLEPGRVAEMVTSSRANDSAITCHSTLDNNPAICRGYFDLPRRPQILQLAERLGVLTFDPEPED